MEIETEIEKETKTEIIIGDHRYALDWLGIKYEVAETSLLKISLSSNG